MTDPIRWTLSPTDSRVVALLRYFPIAFLGGHLGFAALLAVLVVPALLDDPALLALVGLLVLVGGPLSLLYLWPMIRDPDQRPRPAQFGWLADLRPAGVLAATVAGTAALLAGFRVVGDGTRLVLAVVCLLGPLPVVGLFDTDGELDRGAGTLTYHDKTVDTALVESVRAVRVGSFTVVWLSYVRRIGGGWNPHLFVLPESVADPVVAHLRAGASADPGTDPRDPDRLAQAVLVASGLAFVAAAVGVLLTDAAAGIRGYVAVVTAIVGCAFFLAARYVA